MSFWGKEFCQKKCGKRKKIIAKNKKTRLFHLHCDLLGHRYPVDQVLERLCVRDVVDEKNGLHKYLFDFWDFYICKKIQVGPLLGLAWASWMYVLSMAGDARLWPPMSQS